MHLRAFRWQSLSTRVTLFTLVIFVLSIWSQAYYASRTLRQDMQDLLGAQQFSTVSFVADGISYELKARFAALELVAAGIGPALLADTAALQALLEQRPVLEGMFSGGIIAYRLDGTAVAETPISAGRVGTNYMDIDTVAAALKEGKSTVGQPVMGKKLQAPVFGMSVPVRDAQGLVIGALAGVVNLGRPSFLDRIGEGRYGKSGGYVLIAAQSRLVIAASDKSRTMEKLPAVGANAMIDRFLNGYEGFAVMVNPQGNEILAADKAIPVAGWIVGIVLPTAEAFAPIYSMQQRMLLAAILLTLLAGGLTWWMLRRQLSPAVAAAKTLATFSKSDQPGQALPITRQDEIGDLIGGFNHLLESLARREVDLRESRERFDLAVRGSSDGIWDWDILAGTGYVSDRWWALLGYQPGEASTGPGGWMERIHPDDLGRVQEQLGQHLESRVPYAVEFRMQTKDSSYRWFLVRGQALWDAQGRATRVAGSTTDITERKQAEASLQSSLRDKVALLNEVHHRVKNNLQVVASLLRLEAARSNHGDTKAVLADMQGRIRSMALLHETLYRSGIFASIELAGYLKQLATQTFRAQASGSGAVRLELELAPVQVSMDQATPCGLLVNELISNCLKHGFPEGRSGEVRITLQRVPLDHDAPSPDRGAVRVRLCVRDTGVGLRGDFKTLCGQSLGLQLVSDLTRQIDGVLEIGQGPGASFAIVFTADLAQQPEGAV
jgi:PAS domain S-box-containing protein